MTVSGSFAISSGTTSTAANSAATSASFGSRSSAAPAWTRRPSSRTRSSKSATVRSFLVAEAGRVAHGRNRPV
ncbi:hypothetical protein ACFUN7_32245 [Streptomyces sp. NPDC057236]|uniref:hypothetical protein n=1 Tax=Streptomyces sp. NPDC057236 TaxID=3346059 RepID=UPI003635B647